MLQYRINSQNLKNKIRVKNGIESLLKASIEFDLNKPRWLEPLQKYLQIV